MKHSPSDELHDRPRLHDTSSYSIEKRLFERIEPIRKALFVQEGIRYNKSQIIEMALEHWIPLIESKLGIDKTQP